MCSACSRLCAINWPFFLAHSLGLLPKSIKLWRLPSKQGKAQTLHSFARPSVVGNVHPAPCAGKGAPGLFTGAAPQSSQLEFSAHTKAEAFCLLRDLNGVFLNRFYPYILLLLWFLQVWVGERNKDYVLSQHLVRPHRMPVI